MVLPPRVQRESQDFDLGFFSSRKVLGTTNYLFPLLFDTTFFLS